jgi:hypothetical protein
MYFKEDFYVVTINFVNVIINSLNSLKNKEN